jgi:hypothetical protein
MTKVLLVQPRFPVPNKSLNHKDYLPIGLLKLATWHRAKGDQVALSLGDLRTDFEADEVYVTSLFTYWADYVRDAVLHYRLCLPDARITVGGIYASLQPEHCREYTGCDVVWRGVHEGAEQCRPDYSLVPTDFQIIHSSRGCVRRCTFCGTYEIEPEFEPKDSVASEIVKNHLVFYDNNLLANPHIRSILTELAHARVGSRVVTAESQSGFDGRILLEDTHLAELLKSARFRNPRIAWDGGLREAGSIEQQIDVLINAGFKRKDIQVFMLYNHKLPPTVLFEKVGQCFEWGVQVADCRYRPLDLFSDGYLPYRKRQEPGQYYVHNGWTDADVRGLRRTVRANNICIRYVIPRDRYDQDLEGFSAETKHAVARRLGIAATKYTQEQLDIIHREWLESHGTPRRGQDPGLFAEPQREAAGC